MNKTGAEINVRVGGQWIGLDAYQQANLKKGIEAIVGLGIIVLFAGLLLFAL